MRIWTNLIFQCPPIQNRCFRDEETATHPYHVVVYDTLRWCLGVQSIHLLVCDGIVLEVRWQVHWKLLLGIRNVTEKSDIQPAEIACIERVLLDCQLQDLILGMHGSRVVSYDCVRMMLRVSGLCEDLIYFGNEPEWPHLQSNTESLVIEVTWPSVYTERAGCEESTRIKLIYFVDLRWPSG